MSQKALDIIRMRNRERDKAQGFWYQIWQNAADLTYPREDQITSSTMPGEDKSVKVLNATGISDSQEFTSGMIAALFPTGQKAFGYSVRDRALKKDKAVRMWLMEVTEIIHEYLFESNFILHLGETIRGGAACFGTGCFWSEWDDVSGQLNFRDHPVPSFLIKEDKGGNVDTVIRSYKMTARQAVQEFGEDKVGKDVREAASKLDTESKKFGFIHIVRRRQELNPLLSDNLNMPWESLHIDEKAEDIVDESGFEEMPYAAWRWMKGGNEKFGRGQATEGLANLRMLQKMEYDRLTLADRFANPAYLKNQNMEAELDIRPNAENVVQDINNAVKGIDASVQGNFPFTDQTVEKKEQQIHEMFYRDVFVQLGNMKGVPRMTALEVQARLSEGLRRLASPVGRLQSELLTPVILRCLMLLYRHGRLPPAPLALAKIIRRSDGDADLTLDAAKMGVEYIGPLALALQAHQSNAFIQWVEAAMGIAKADPTVMDNINLDDGFRDFGEGLGVAAEAMATQEEIQQKRAARQKQMAQQQAMQLADVAGKTYKNAATGPDPGSPAESLMGAGGQ